MAPAHSVINSQISVRLTGVGCIPLRTLPVSPSQHSVGSDWLRVLEGVCLPMWETWVRSLGGEDPLGEENGSPLQYSCLEDPMDRGAWWAIYPDL